MINSIYYEIIYFVIMNKNIIISNRPNISMYNEILKT
jgi:hypothetical protein